VLEQMHVLTERVMPLVEQGIKRKPRA